MAIRFKPQANMTFATVKQDCSRLRDSMQSAKGRELVIELSHVTQCDSAGLAFLLECKRIALVMKKPCRIENMPDFMTSLAQFSGLESVV